MIFVSPTLLTSSMAAWVDPAHGMRGRSGVDAFSQLEISFFWSPEGDQMAVI